MQRCQTAIVFKPESNQTLTPVNNLGVGPRIDAAMPDSERLQACGERRGRDLVPGHLKEVVGGGGWGEGGEAIQHRQLLRGGGGTSFKRRASIFSTVLHASPSPVEFGDILNRKELGLANGISALTKFSSGANPTADEIWCPATSFRRRASIFSTVLHASPSPIEENVRLMLVLSLRDVWITPPRLVLPRAIVEEKLTERIESSMGTIYSRLCVPCATA